MTNLAGEMIDARCVDCVYIYTHIYVRSIVGFRGGRPDPDETFDNSKMTGFG
jgi:hypothetical protein